MTCSVPFRAPFSSWKIECRPIIADSPLNQERSMAKEQRTMKAAKKAPAKTMMEKRAAKAAKRSQK